MNIAVVGSYWAKYSRNRALIQGLAANGVRVREYHFEVPAEKMEKPGDLTIQSLVKRAWQKLKGNLYILSLYKHLREFDVILTLYPGHLDLFAVWFMGKLLQKPIVFDGGMSLYDVTVIDKGVLAQGSWSGQLIKHFEQFLLKLPDLIMVDTQEMKAFLHQELQVPLSKLCIIPISANDKLYVPATKVPRNKKTRVFFFGLYNPLQGAFYIAKAAKLLANRPDIEIVMLGEGPTKAAVEAYISTHKLNNVKLLGFVPEPQLVAEIQTSDIVLGIFSDSSIAQRVVANKVYAGLACEKPVITAGHQAVKSLFKHKVHLYMVEPENEKSLAQGIIELTDNPKLRHQIATKGYQYFQQYVSPKAIGKLLIDECERNIL